MNAQKKDANMSLQRQLASGILAETIKFFKGCTIQSKFNDSVSYDSDKQVTKIYDSEQQVDVSN